MVDGYATPEGTARYTKRNQATVDPFNFSITEDGLCLSKLIYGTGNGYDIPT